MKLTLPHPVAGEMANLANPIRFSDTPIRYERAAPTLGEHTDEVLATHLGMPVERIASLKARGII
jgi:crotonobetainyl-CoA:carnitine CoA-transferase CaiB-like acyl-CoA transferase